MARDTPPCVNCACNTKAAPIEFCTFSILGAWRFFCWAATRPPMIAGTRETFRSTDQIYDNYLSEIDEEEDDAKNDEIQ